MPTHPVADNICPCCAAQLTISNTSHHLFEILDKWQIQTGGFSEKTWSDYPEDVCLILYNCPSCEFGIFLPMTPGTDSFYADITRNEYYQLDRWEFHIGVSLLKKTKSSSLLDVGCGKGAFLKMAGEQIPELVRYGVDNNPLVKDDLVDMFTELSLAPDNLDMVTLFQVVEHVSDPLGLLKEAVAKVKPGGIVMVSVPDNTGPIRYFANFPMTLPPHHVTLWTPKSLKAILTSLGLTILKEKSEPLPDYLMPFYLPQILIHFFKCQKNPKWSDRITRYVANPITNICKKFAIKSLPVKGHTLLIVARK